MAPIQAMRHRAGQVLALGLCLFLVTPGWAAASPTSSAQSAPASVTTTRNAVGTLTPHALGPGQPSVRNGKAVMPFHTLAPGALRAAKLRAAAQASLGQRGPLAPVRLPLTGLFNGLNGSGLSDYAATPPDSTGAIGPTRYVEMVNQQIGVFDRTNLAMLSSTDNGSFTGASILDSVSDPQVQWDPQANRWFYSAIAVSHGDNLYLGPQTKLELWHFVSNAGTPALLADGSVTVPSFDIPASAPQAGSSFTLDTLDARLTQAVAVNDPGTGGAKGIWTQHTVAGPGGRSVVRWYEVTAGSPPVLRQQGQVDSSTDFVLNGAISPAIGGDSAAIFYNRSGTSGMPIIGAQSRGPSTLLGTMD